MNILFPSSPISPRTVDEAFDVEAVAAKEAGFGISRVDLEILLGGAVKVAGIPEVKDGYPDARDILYRGWLMKPEQYQALSARLERRLVTGPVSYEIAYNLPQWYPLFAEGVTPRTLILPGTTFDLDDVVKHVYQTFGHNFTAAQLKEIDEIQEWQRVNGTMIIQNRPDLLNLPRPYPVMVKDYLKSAKHRWFDACYMPDCQDFENVKRVTRNFLDTQGDGLTGGLCFRQFIPCTQIGVHSKTRAPLFNEWRAFLKYGKVIYLAPYWAEGDYSTVPKPGALLIAELCKGLKDLPLVAVDIGQREWPSPPGEEAWVVFEVNDGGSAGVPEGGNVNEFYRVLFKEFAG